MNKFGVIDLGTNTFHLLVVELKANGSFSEVYRERIFVQLAENGIEKIGESPFNRALDAINRYATILKAQNVEKIAAFGTAALRTASNSKELIREIKIQSGIDVAVIQGIEEARLIHLGVSMAVPLNAEKGLIMDIGGGSVEFILADHKKVYWSGSFQIGVAVLFNRFHYSNPISDQEILSINTELSTQLAEMLDAIEHHQPALLIGASGTFDVLENLLRKEKLNSQSSRISGADFFPFYNKLIKSNLEERLAMPGLPDSRAKLIVVALVLIRFILSNFPIRNIMVSSYAMKEGIIHSMIEELKSR